ncbi:hypothetical protein [Accumulibacter sp.]|uniref:hypothetical protein n=1 Tax=Accumulibacter sp. TaxID=2053492 RepID=UPI0025F77C14|nr:hypothetical protein [Accumulibacter sp.]MCM8611556.1 hypothetical protein [Accumulibacter sp.]MCM8635190.1 hypothetical protein [Accumulibacter sp.]MCM8640464.1 hypothetical protein [Accumulibacter sp.]
MDHQDLGAIAGRRQVDEEDPVEPALRSSSGGNCEMSFAVATTNTGCVFSSNSIPKSGGSY